MKVVALTEAKQDLSGYVDRAQKERILITRHGRPAALVIGVEGKELEEVMIEGDPKFWAWIRDRRAQADVPYDEALGRLKRSERKRSGKPSSSGRARPTGKGRSR
jgi:prevent-host-death family protein